MGDFFAALKEQDDREVSVKFWLIPMEVNEADPNAKVRSFEEEIEATSDIIADL